MHGAAAFVGNVHELDVRRGAEELAGEVAAGARVRGAACEPGRLPWRAGDDVLEGPGGSLLETRRTFGKVVMPPMAVRSLRGSKLSFMRLTLVASESEAMRMV